MSAIVSIFHRDGRPVEAQAVDRMLAASPDRAVDGQSKWIDNDVALAHQHFWIAPEDWGEIQPLVAVHESQVITADARLDNRDEILRLLDIDLVDGDQLSDARLILMAYSRWGTGCVERFLGDFAFAIWDADESSLFLARDALGNRGLCYSTGDDHFLAASEVAQLLAHPSVTPKINEGKVAAYLTDTWRDQKESFYKRISYCPPGHCLVVTRDSVRQWCYWEIDAQARIRYANDQEYTDHFMALLTEAIHCRLRTVGPAGISMSGGLDSTVIAAIASNLLPQMGLPQKRLKSFSYVFDELRSCDERRYIQPVADRYDLDTTFIGCDDKWTLRDIENWPVLTGFVFADAYAWLPKSVMEAAEQAGCRVLLSGYNGDALLWGGIYWAAAMINDFRIGELIRNIIRHSAAIDWRRDLWSNGLRQIVPDSWRAVIDGDRSVNLYNRFPGLHADMVDYVLAYWQQDASDPRRQDFSLQKWSQYRSLTSSLMAQGISATRSQYNHHGIELLMPYWDRRLVEFVMAVPADQLGRPGRDRWLMRNGAQELLPTALAERRQRTVFTPLMKKGLMDKESSTVEQIFTDPLIVERKYVRSGYLDYYLQNDRGWYNYSDRQFLWKCLSLELWLRHGVP